MLRMPSGWLLVWDGGRVLIGWVKETRHDSTVIRLQPYVVINDGATQTRRIASSSAWISLARAHVMDHMEWVLTDQIRQDLRDGLIELEDIVECFEIAQDIDLKPLVSEWHSMGRRIAGTPALDEIASRVETPYECCECAQMINLWTSAPQEILIRGTAYDHCLRFYDSDPWNCQCGATYRPCYNEQTGWVEHLEPKVESPEEAS